MDTEGFLELGVTLWGLTDELKVSAGIGAPPPPPGASSNSRGSPPVLERPHLKWGGSAGGEGRSAEWKWKWKILMSVTVLARMAIIILLLRSAS